jgi:hypothetical protein
MQQSIINYQIGDAHTTAPANYHTPTKPTQTINNKQQTPNNKYRIINMQQSIINYQIGDAHTTVSPHYHTPTKPTQTINTK